MNPRNTWKWIAVAALLFTFIIINERYLQHPKAGPAKVLPNLKAVRVTSVQVRPPVGLDIKVVRTNGAWQLTEPLVYPAQAISIDKLLVELEQLVPAPYLSPRKLRGGANTDEEYGFVTPQASIIIDQPGYMTRLRIGAKTPPGNQVYLQVVGVEGVYVVDVGLLKYVPHKADDWRDTALLDLSQITFDRLAVTNGAKVFELRRDPATRLWRMTWPLSTRANTAKVEESLQMLQSVRVAQFLPEDQQPNLDSLGLHPPELEIALSQGTNVALQLQFGRSLTNDTSLVYARRVGLSTIVAVPRELLAPWYATANEFRDPLFLNLTAPITEFDVSGPDNFSVQQQTNGSWRVLPEGFAADAALVRNVVSAFSELRIAEFTNDVVTAPELTAYGLTPPARHFVLNTGAAIAGNGATNTVIADFSLGTNHADTVFARRKDESSVYLVKLAEVLRLPIAGWQMRDRRIWSLATNDVARVSLRDQGRVRQLVRNGPYSWSLAAGSQGVVNELAVEDTIGALCQLSAIAWLGRGEVNRARFGFDDKSRQITLEFKNGTKATVDFGNEAAGAGLCAGVMLDKELWVFEFPAWLYEYVQRYLSVPPNS